MSFFSGARMSVKTETTKKNTQRKLSYLRRLLKWLVDYHNTSKIDELFEGIAGLGASDGYYILYPNRNSSKGFYTLWCVSIEMIMS